MISIRDLFARRPARSAELEVRTMQARDRAAVQRMEAASFPYVWSERLFEHFLLHPLASGHVLERFEEPVGFFFVLRERGFLHLANLAVAPAARRSGVATRALLAVENIAWAWGLARVELEVHESNLAAQLLYRRSGYRAVEILRGYYGSEDAYRMTKAVPPLTEGRPR